LLTATRDVRKIQLLTDNGNRWHTLCSSSDHDFLASTTSPIHGSVCARFSPRLQQVLALDFKAGYAAGYAEGFKQSQGFKQGLQAGKALAKKRMGMF
jgi:hypothetical protein